MDNLEDNISVDTVNLLQLAQDEWKKEISDLQSLSKKVCFLHTDLLYYRNAESEIGIASYEAWKVLLKKVGGTPNGWRDLGYALDVNQDDLDYIMASVKEDPVDMVLKVFRQNEKATLDKVTDAFIKMKRYDILKSLEDPLCKLSQFFQRDDSGYQSNGNTGHMEIVSLKNLINDLPAALSNLMVDSRDPDKPKQTLRAASSHSETIERDEQILFLTYTQDGIPTAINIQEYVDNWIDFPNVKVITLNGKKDEIYENPERFIREYFEKAAFIVPIITTGYIDTIKSNSNNLPNTSGNLDHKYVNFIYSLIVNHYVATGCLNKKVRSVLPQNANVDLIQKILFYPDLCPWTYEVNFDEQFQEFLKKD